MEINWTEFDEFSEDTCECRCGTVFRSHAKYIGAEIGMLSRKSCPKCGRNNDLCRVSSDPEIMTLRKG